MLTLAALKLPGLRHAFFGRDGGVSDGVYASLNCGFGSGDDPRKVAENRSRALAMAGMTEASLLTAYQVHSPDVVVVTKPWMREDAPKADGMVTDRPGIALGILTADCAPVLFCDPEAGVIGAAHAGWRGALTGVLEATIETMRTLGARPDRIVAGIGPCIGPRSYEVGPEFPAPFLAQDPANAAFFAPAARPGHHMFDLPGFVAARLARLGLGAVDRLSIDTCAESDRFFSYRRTTLCGGKDYGRALSAICLES